MDNGQSGIQLIGGLEAKEPTFIPVSGRKTFLTFPSYRSGNYTQGPSPRSRARHLTGYYLLRGKRYTPPGAGLGAGPGHGGGCKESGELFQLFEHGHGYKAAELIKFGKSPWRTKTFYSDSYYAIRFVKDGPTGVSLDNGRLNHEVLYSEVLPLLRYRSSCYVYAIPDVIVGAEPLTALSRDEVQSIVDRFQSLNPYDQKLGSILKIHKLNWDCSKNRRQLFGIGIAAKRYALYTKSKRDIQIVEPKAHGLGYFYAPKDSREAWDADSPEWIFEAWAWIVRGQLGLKRSNPAWFNLPVMMRLTLSTPHHALKNLAKGPLTRPHNFMMMPQISRFGCPQGVDPDKFTLITAFCSERNQWMQSKCINVHDPDSPMYELSDEYDGSQSSSEDLLHAVGVLPKSP